MPDEARRKRADDDHELAASDRVNAALDRLGATVDRDGATVDRDGATVDRDGATVDRDGALRDHRPAIDDRYQLAKVCEVKHLGIEEFHRETRKTLVAMQANIRSDVKDLHGRMDKWSTALLGTSATMIVCLIGAILTLLIKGCA
jgi:hypothetical protein